MTFVIRDEARHHGLLLLFSHNVGSLFPSIDIAEVSGRIRCEPWPGDDNDGWTQQKVQRNAGDNTAKHHHCYIHSLLVAFCSFWSFSRRHGFHRKITCRMSIPSWEKEGTPPSMVLSSNDSWRLTQTTDHHPLLDFAIFGRGPRAR
jgi:hypothetical protein